VFFSGLFAVFAVISRFFYGFRGFLVVFAYDIMLFEIRARKSLFFVIEILDELRLFIDKKVIFSEEIFPSVCRPEFKILSTTLIRAT
jgi:hypothetical protein